MRKYRVILLFCFLALAGNSFASDCIFVSTSEGSRHVVFFNDDRLFQVYDGLELTRAFHVDGLIDVQDVPLQVDINFSPHNDFLLISFNVSESQRISQVYRFPSMIKVFEKYATNARWLDEGMVVYVPDYSVDVGPSKKGLIRHDLNTDESVIIFNDLYFTGEFYVGGNQVFARIMRKPDGEPVYESILGDFSSRKYIFLND
ncbi:MAG: hypothetical protein ACQES2_01365 [Pseudomonadota bacterium]